MGAHENILDMLREKAAVADRNMQRGLIVQPGAIGDCILTLPLAAFMKDALRLGGIDLLGHTEYSGIFPGRSCIDGVRSLDSMDLHRLFVKPEAFELAEPDPLITAFSDYAWIATFLGEPDSHFEQNLIFTANCSHSAEVLTLPLKPPKDFCEHVIDFHIRQFVSQCPSARTAAEKATPSVQTGDCLIRATEADIETGKRLLTEAAFEAGDKLVVIHPGSGGARKCWCLENFLAIAAELASEGVQAAFLLGPAESDKFGNAAARQKMNRVGRCLSGLSLTEVLGLLSCAEGFVGNDSGITHLAAAMGVRTLAVFGPTNPTVYKPVGPEVTVFSSSSSTFAQKPSARLQRKLLARLTS